MHKVMYKYKNICREQIWLDSALSKLKQAWITAKEKASDLSSIYAGS